MWSVDVKSTQVAWSVGFFRKQKWEFFFISTYSACVHKINILTLSIFIYTPTHIHTHVSSSSFNQMIEDGVSAGLCLRFYIVNISFFSFSNYRSDSFLLIGLNVLMNGRKWFCLNWCVMNFFLHFWVFVLIETVKIIMLVSCGDGLLEMSWNIDQFFKFFAIGCAFWASMSNFNDS